MSFELESATSSPNPLLTATLGHQELPPAAVPEPWWQHVRQATAAAHQPQSAAETRAEHTDSDRQAQESLDHFLQETGEDVAMPPPMLPATMWEWNNDRDGISSTTNGFSSDDEAPTPVATHLQNCKMPAPPAPPMLMSMDADAIAPSFAMRRK